MKISVYSYVTNSVCVDEATDIGYPTDCAPDKGKSATSTSLLVSRYYDKQKRIKPLDIVGKQSNKVDKNAFWRKTGSTPKGQSEFIETPVAYRLNCAFNKRIVFP